MIILIVHNTNSLSLSSLLVTIEEVIRLLVAGPLEVQREYNEGRKEGGPNESAIINTESLNGRRYN